MKKCRTLRTGLMAFVAAAAGVAASTASAQVYITEWLYQGGVGEFIEFTNLGSTAVDFTGWSYDDDSRLVGAFSLSAFGVVNPGESVILTEASAAAFIAEWNLPGTVKVIGGYTNNLGRNDEINLFDANGMLVDRLAYGDQNFPGTIRTQGVSGTPVDFYALGANDPYGWSFSVVGDAHGSYASLAGVIGSPGTTAFAPVPLPAAGWLLLSGLVGLVGIGRRRREENVHA